MSAARVLVRVWPGWTVRVAAWAGLAALFVLPVWTPDRTAMRATMFQTRVRGESERAAADLLRRIGIDDTYPTETYRAVAGLRNEFEPPTWVWVQRRDGTSTGKSHWVWVNASGMAVRPAMITSTARISGYTTVPETIEMLAADGSRVLGAWWMASDMSGDKEYLVWVHRNGAWRNVAHFELPWALGAELGLTPRPDVRGVERLEVRCSQPLPLLWDADRLTFELPAPLPSGFKALPPAPDQFDPRP